MPIARADAQALEWFLRVAEELKALEGGERSWRREVAKRLRAIVEENQPLTQEDGRIHSVVALELVAEEDEAALDRGPVTWRSLADHDPADLGHSLVSQGGGK